MQRDKTSTSLPTPDPMNWTTITESASEDTVREVSDCAFTVSDALPARPTSSDLAACKDPVSRFRAALVPLRAACTQPDLLPGENANDLELALWAMRLALYLSRTRTS